MTLNRLNRMYRLRDLLQPIGFSPWAKALNQVGVSETELQKETLAEDAKRAGQLNFGATMMQWMKKAGTGALKILGKALEQVLVAAVRAYLGI